MPFTILVTLRAGAQTHYLQLRGYDPYGLTAKMPQLPPGHKYIWDPATQELLVERPRLKTQ